MRRAEALHPAAFVIDTDQQRRGHAQGHAYRRQDDNGCGLAEQKYRQYKQSQGENPGIVPNQR